MGLLLGSSPAAAQAGDAAVACVGSKLETLDSSNPVRRVITEDVAVVYRVGVGSEDRERMERVPPRRVGRPRGDLVRVVQPRGQPRGDRPLIRGRSGAI